MEDLFEEIIERDLKYKELEDEYKVETKEGNGSFGTVFRVTHKVSSHPYAAKRIDLILDKTDYELKRQLGQIISEI